MRLKKLELFGFKSFGDKTEVFFDKGVTCVVGPNGCGKSNISDAIRWVLGERSAKMLRGSKMEDVIFNGTDFRKAVSYAEVSLTFDNQDRGLPIDYSEVTITRRLHRSGESEYLINKTLVRLKDVQDLILDTGVGSNSYSMIEQGRIDYILNADPEKRRFLIEEAAGISKYKVKKDEALRKLERTEANLLRLNDIVQEVQKNIQYAERQAKRAERYKEKYVYLKNLEIRKAFYDLNLLNQEKSSIQGVRSDFQSELDHYQVQKSALHQVLAEQEGRHNQAQQRYSVEESGRYRLVSQKEKNEQQLKFHQEKRVEFAMRKGEIQQEQAQLSGHLEKSATEIAAKRQALEGIAAEIQKIQEGMGHAEQNLTAAEGRLEEVKHILEKGKLEAFELAAETTRIKNEYHRMLAFMETSDKQKGKMDGNLERYQSEREGWEIRKQGYQDEVKSLEAKQTALEAQAVEEKNLLETAEEKLRQEDESRERTERLIHEKSTRLNVLRDLDAATGTDKETLLRAIPELQANLLYSLREILRVDGGYEWALEAALGAWAHSLVTEDLESAQKLFRFLGTNQTGGLGVLVRSLQSHSATAETMRPDHPGIGRALTEVVHVQAGFQDLMRPFLSNVYVAEHLDENNLGTLLQAAGDCRIVSREGICLGPSGRIYFRLGLQQEQNLFRRGSEMGSVAQEIEALQVAHAAHCQSKEELQRQLNELEVRREATNAKKVELKIQRESLESMKVGLEERLQSHRRETQLVMEEILEIQSQQTEVKDRKEYLEKELQELGRKEQHHREFENRMLKEINEKDRHKNEMLQEFAERKARFENIRDQGAILQESLDFLQVGEAKDKQRIEHLKDEMVRITEKEQELSVSDEKLNAEQQQIDDALRQADVALELIRQEKAKCESSMDETRRKLEEFLEKQKQIQENLHQSDMKAMDLGYQEKAIHERLDQTYQINLETLNRDEFPWEQRNPPEVEAELTELREKVKSMGAVNLLAIEEYEEMKQRYDFLAGQKQDLENSRAELLEAIRKINRTTRSLFDETFANVQRTFAEYYQTLFRGGEARLVLVDETQPLESGIDIVVRPPGKKLQHISLLSGGEKALTAIALLFALFKIKPSPFCVLDEVDAPLDEANIDRFLTVLRTFLQTSQFIIITHNRKTIGMGDSLYGVTMQEAGVSKIVSVKVSEDAKDHQTENAAKPSEKIEDSVVA